MLKKVRALTNETLPSSKNFLSNKYGVSPADPLQYSQPSIDKIDQSNMQKLITTISLFLILVSVSRMSQQCFCNKSVGLLFLIDNCLVE